jgi:hypothetical protein
VTAVELVEKLERGASTEAVECYDLALSPQNLRGARRRDLRVRNFCGMPPAAAVVVFEGRRLCTGAAAFI